MMVSVRRGLVLAALLCAAAACTREAGPPSATDGGDASIDIGAAFDGTNADIPATLDATADDPGGEQHPSLDVATDEPHMLAPDGGDGSDAALPTNDATDLDVIADGEGHDSDEPVDAAMSDAQDATLDADAISEGDGSMVPIFPNCVYSRNVRAVPLAIFEATIAPGRLGSCTCNAAYNVVIHRFMCGSFPPGEAVSIAAMCSFPAGTISDPQVGDRFVMMVTITTCILPQYFGNPAYPSEWNAILADQIANGASDAGPVDGASGD